MGKLRTGNKRHNRALAKAVAAAKATETIVAKTAPAAKKAAA